MPTSWAELFERARGHEVDLETVLSRDEPFDEGDLTDGESNRV